MDSMATLARMRELVTEIRACDETAECGLDDHERAAELGNELADLVEALDGWMSKGGFSPWK